VTLKPALRVTRGHRKFGTDTYRSATYDFLLTFHSNHLDRTVRLRNKRRFQSKIAKIFPLRVFCATAEGVPLELGTGAGAHGVKKLDGWGYQADERI